MFQSEFCNVNYLPDINVVFVEWKEFCCDKDYREPLLHAIDIMKTHANCHYVADTRNGFENEEADTQWVFNEFIPLAASAGCKYIFFIIQPDNRLKEELEGQSVELKKHFEVIACYGLDEVKEILGKIRQVTLQDDFVPLAKLLNEAFATVAKEFGLTQENSPTNNAFITSDALKAQLTDNREFYACEEDGKAIGFIAIEKSLTDTDTFYIEKLAVIPASRHSGIGRQLMNFATDRIAELGGKRISIGLINSNTVLKNWYTQQGYTEFSIKTFEHLPFDVCIMERYLLY